MPDFHPTIRIFQEGLLVEQMNRYASPINPAVFPHLTIVLLSIGIFFMAWFFVYPFKCGLYKFDSVLIVCMVSSIDRSIVLLDSENGRSTKRFREKKS